MQTVATERAHTIGWRQQQKRMFITFSMSIAI